MFQTKEEQYAPWIETAEKNYKIRPNDYLVIAVYTNGGERIIDPNFELQTTTTGGGKPAETERPRFLVQETGIVQLPMIGNVMLGGLTVIQADSVLSMRYNQFYEGSFVMTKVINKRVFVFGALGGKVIPLENESMNLIEVLALYGGVTKDGKADNIRLIRGDLNNPQVQIIDLSTIEGMKKANLNVEVNDIIYIEEQKRIVSETLRDIIPIFSIIGNLLTVTFLVLRNTKN
jgi:polysaccharide export outer membrane protein